MQGVDASSLRVMRAEAHLTVLGAATASVQTVFHPRVLLWLMSVAVIVSEILVLRLRGTLFSVQKQLWTLANVVLKLLSRVDFRTLQM